MVEIENTSTGEFLHCVSGHGKKSFRIQQGTGGNAQVEI